MGWETDWEKDMEKDMEQSNDMDSVTSDSMEKINDNKFDNNKFEDSFFDDFFEDSKDQEPESSVTEDDLAGLVFDDVKDDKSDLQTMFEEEEETSETGGAKVLKLSKTKGDRSVSHRDLEADAEGIRALNEFYMESANEIYDNMKAISEDNTLSPVEKLEKMQYESRRWEICKREWEKDANGKK